MVLYYKIMLHWLPVKINRVDNQKIINSKQYPKGDLNPHSCNSQRILSPSCLPFHHSGSLGAKNGTRTRDPNLGKVVLYQLSYFRNCVCKDRMLFRFCQITGRKIYGAWFYICCDVLSLSGYAGHIRLSESLPVPLVHGVSAIFASLRRCHRV